MSRVSGRAKKVNPKYAEEDHEEDDYGEHMVQDDDDEVDSPPKRKSAARAHLKVVKSPKEEVDENDRSKRGREEEFEDEEETKKRRRMENKNLLDQKLEEALAASDDEGNGEEEGGFKITRTSMEAGQIVELYMENFMCHRKFSMKFGKNVNFISGKNGSGKSSIVSALQVCLGSTAKSAGRGSKMEEYIREGSAGPAIIKITMINEGSDAFEPEKYGNRITVERRITRSSGNCYILYNHAGKEVTRRKSDLERMLQTFNIYVDNPCNVMTQEESKVFIRAKNHEKYIFFLKATGLHRLREDLEEIGVEIEESIVQASKQKDRIAKKEQSVKEVEELLNKMKELETLEDRIRINRAKVFWTDLRAAEDELATIQKELDEKERQLAQAKSAYDKAMNMDTSSDEEIARIKETIDELTRESEQIEVESTKKQDEITRSNVDLRAAKADLSKAEHARDDFSYRKKQIEAHIAELRQKAAQNSGADTRGIVKQMDELERNIQVLKEEETSLRREKDQLAQEATHAEGSMRRAGAEISNLKTQIQRSNEEVQSMMSEAAGSGKKVAVFGQAIADLCRDIQKNRHKFRDQVHGPLGMHMSMKEEYAELEKAIERALGTSVFAFVVTNNDDRRTLQQMLHSCGNNVAKVIMQAPHARYVPAALPNHVVTASMTVNVEEDLIYNVLLDQFSLDRVGLVRRNDEALREYVDRSGSMKMLKYGLASVIDNEKCDILMYRSGNASNEPNRYGFKGYISRDMSSFIDTANAEIQAKRERLHAAEQQRQTEVTRLNAVRAKEVNVNQRLRQVEGLLRTKQQSVDALQNQLEEANEAETIDTTMQEQERNELQVALDGMEPQIAAVKERLTTLSNSSKTLAQAKKELDANRQRIFTRIQEQQTEIERLLSQRANEKRRIETLKKRVDEKCREVEVEAKKVDKANSALDHARQSAETQTRTLMPDWDGQPLRLSRNENRPALERQIKELQAKFTAAKREAGLQGYSLQILQDRFDKADAELQEMIELFNTLESNIAALTESKEQRTKKWAQALKHCSKVVKKAFDNYASRKGSAGTVQFDHRNGILDIRVQVDAADENSLANDIMNLSGGERSYVTFCFQLALGHVIECPFRLLDEYDVYMDESTRTLSLQMMQRYALERPDQRQRQFLILTPHSMRDVTASNLVKVLYMPEPQRMTAQGLQQQTL